MKEVKNCNLDRLHVTGISWEDDGDMGDKLQVNFVLFNVDSPAVGCTGKAVSGWPDHVRKTIKKLRDQIEETLSEGYSLENKEDKEDKEKKNDSTDRGSIPGIAGFRTPLGGSGSSPKQL